MIENGDFIINPELINKEFYYGKNQKTMTVKAGDIPSEKDNDFVESVTEKAASDAQAEQEEPKKEEQETPASLMDDILDDHYSIPEEERTAQEEADNEEFEEATEEDFQFFGEDEAREGDDRFEGINLADFITAQMALEYYGKFMVKLLKGIAVLMKHKGDIADERIMVSDEIQEISADLLDVYWSTIKIKVNPVLAAFCLMTGASIYNFVEAIAEEKKKAKTHSSSTPVDAVDIDFEEILEQAENLEDNE